MQVNLDSIKNIDIVCFSLSRWDAPISSPAVSLAKEFAKNNRVFYIEHPYSFKNALFEKRNKQVERQGNVTVITPPVTWPINFLPKGFLYNSFAAINDTILLNTLRLIIKEIDITNYVFINFFDPFFLRNIPRDIKPLKFVYQCMDDLSEVPYTAKHGVRLENEIIKNADITLCTSRELTKLKSEISPNVYFHPNAADVELFKTAFGNGLPRPADVPEGKKIIGFTGSIEYRTDFELLKKIAEHHQDKILFLVGPVSTEEHILYGLHKLPNVIFAGAKKIDELPAYLQCFDCCIIPYRQTKLTKSIYPLKINEYLAAGKPVVSTNFSEDIISFSDVAHIVSNHERFIDAINKAIDTDDQNKKYARLSKASLNSWEHRVQEFWKIILAS